MSSEAFESATPTAAPDEHLSIQRPLSRPNRAPLVHDNAVPARAFSPRAGQRLPGPPIEPAPRQGPLPASFAQQRLWFVAKLFPESCTYNEPIMVTMGGPVDAAALARSLTEITRRHEAWRTVFTDVDGVPVQQIRPPHPFDLPVVDLTSLPIEQREAEARRRAVFDARRPFDLQEGPLVRALLLRVTETDARLIVTAHHIVVDGVSFFSVFLPELHALYVACASGQPSPLPELPIQYADFAAWQRRWLTEEELAPKLAYWRAHLAGMTELDLPLDHPRPSQPVERGARAPIALSAELMKSLLELGHKAGVTLFTTLLAAWKTLLFRYTDQGDIVVGSAAAGRPRPELDRLIGFLNHNLVLRTQLDGAWTFLELLPRVHDVLRAAREHEDVPFDRLIAELKVERSLNRNPLYNNVFILMPPLSPPSDPPRWSASRFDIGMAKVDLYLELHQRPAGLVGHIEYPTELFSAATIERMIGHLQTLLEGIARDPGQRLAELPILTEGEQRELRAWQGPRVAARPDSEVASLEQLFEAQAARSPEAIAVAHGAERVTYRELNARANQLANYLRAQGVGPDRLVGLCVKRSVNALAGILGVLKAGGAYVPLDPEYPSERLRFILEDADIALLLTDAGSAGAAQKHRGRTVLLDKDWPAIAEHGAENPEPIASPEHLAYVIYTSGSTGRPKGAQVERRGLFHLARAQEAMFGLGVGSRVLQFFSLNFDGSVWDLALTWPVGATLVLADREALLPGPNLVQLLKDEDIHAVMVTPSALAVTPFAELPALRTLITAGEALPEELVSRWAPGRRFFNVYGPTETTVVSVLAECRAGEGKPPIGRPFAFVQVYILDGAMRPVPVGVPGELFIGGPAVARGYLKRPELTEARFLPDPFPEAAGARLYRTGDRVKWRPDGSIEYLGRTDRQIKLRGFRIELGEIEAELERHPAVQAAAAEVLDGAGEGRLIAYVVPRAGAPADLERALKEHLRERLPAPMVPGSVVTIDRMPLNPNGKIDRARLRATRPSERREAAATTTLEQAVATTWREVLGVDAIDLDASFFDIGGHSLALARVQAKLCAKLRVDVDVVTLMRLPTIRTLAAHLATLPGIERVKAPPEPVQRAGSTERSAAPAPAPSPERPHAIAIVGMAIRAPGVRSAEELWDVIRDGRETIRALDPEALIAAGANPTRVRRPEFVPAEGVLDGADRFDAAFFGFNDADAALMDPQQRLFLECAHEALEHAGCDPGRFPGRVGVFGGAGAALHWLGPVMQTLRANGSDLDHLRARTLNAPDFLATRVAFKLGLRGPAVTVQTACSTSLAAVHLARQSLLAGECDMAIAGGVALSTLRDADRGYIHDGGALSADGHCRPFDADATGMVKASGVAIVVMKPLAAALADGDTIHAVVIGSAMNNDGAGKMGFTAPSEDGVAEAIQRAYEAAGVDPGEASFVEAHGTGTRIGDPIEVRALTRAFRRWTEERGFCALGSLKANVGHLDAAAGAAGVIKAALTLARDVIPPVAGFRAPNPLLDLPSTPFFASGAPLPWPRTKTPRRAGVNAMGVGGTNVHVVLEEAPPAVPASEAPTRRRPFQLLCLSARTPTALGEVARRLEGRLAQDPAIDLADAAHTLAVGRAPQRYRATAVCQDALAARSALTPEAMPALVDATPTATRARPVVFLFSGYGGQYVQMGLEAYETEPVFRAEVDRCFEIARDAAGLDLRAMWLGLTPDDERRFEEAQSVQPLLFTIEYALARQLMAWGVRPTAMLGHSLGEYVAASVAGVLSLRDALALVATRGRLADATPPGRMLAVLAAPRAVEPHLDDGVSIATYAPRSVVLAGLPDAIEAARARLVDAGIEVRDVRASRAGHSPVMRAIRDAFRQRVAEVELRPPTVPIVSNMTGTYMTAEQATSPDAWADHLCNPVRLDAGFGALLELDSPICIEIGPGLTLSAFLKGHPQYARKAVDVVGTLPDARKRKESSCAALLRGLGRAWELGVEVDWKAFYGHEKRRRIPLPTYPFEGQRYTLGAALNEEPAPSLDARASVIARELGVRGVDDHPGLRPRLEALCASLVLDFFARRLGDRVPHAHTREALQRSTGILPKLTPMFEELVRILLRAGLARETPAGEILLHVEEIGRSAELSARLRQEHPGFHGLVRFIEHCVSRYDEALTGITEPVGVLFPDGTEALYRSFLRDTSPYIHDQVYLALAREAVLEIIGRRAGQTTRILEVGAGHGILTWPLVETLRQRGADVEYHFTDIGRSFLQRAEAEASRLGIAWMKTSRFDLNRRPEEQGIHGRYDVILGFNSVTVATDTAAMLGNLHGLLAPSGSLLIVTKTRIETWDDVTFGLAPGYWDVAHTRGAPTLKLSFWEDMLPRAGFVRVATAPRDPGRREVEDHGIVMAERSPAAPAAPAAPEAPAAPTAKSADPLEQVVQSIWKRLLGATNAPPGASFFDLGGDSLLAVQLLSELRAKTGHEIKMKQFAAQPTAEGLTAFLRSQLAPAPITAPATPAPITPLTAPEREGAAKVLVDAPRAAEARAASSAASSATDDCLVPLRAAGSKRPFFCVHPIGGGALCYAPLARAMDPERPFFGIQSPMLEDRSARPDSIEDMASRYVDAIQRAQPSGPYLLGGWSFGGVIAAAMARQLKRRGQTLAELVLFDAIAEPSAGSELLRLVDPRLPALAMLPAIFAGPERRAEHTGRAAPRDLSRVAETLASAAQNLVVYDHHLAIWRRHAPADPGAPTTHFVPEKRRLRGAWLHPTRPRNLPVDGATLVPVPGDHFSMLSADHAASLAERLDRTLDAADQRERARADAGAPGLDEASVRAFLQRFLGAMMTRDAAALVDELWSQSSPCVLFSVDSVIAGVGPIKAKYARSFGALREIKARLHDERVLLLDGGRAACATALLDTDLVVARDGLRVSHRDVRVSWVLEKQGPSWRAIHAHYSPPMAEPDGMND